MKRFKTFILTAMIMCLMGTSIISAYEAEEPINLSYKKIDNDGNGIEDSIAIVYDKAYTSANSIIIPEEIDGLPVTELSEYAFVESGLVSIELPDSLEKIGNGAFMFCGNLKNIEVPESVKYICENAFNSCTAAESIKILNSECEIYDSYFTMLQFTGTIYGNENSTAHEYAEKYDYSFSIIDAEPEVTTPAVTTTVTTSEAIETTISQTEMTTPEETKISQVETSVSQKTTSEAVITTVSQVETSSPEETTESQTETSVSQVTTSEAVITTVSQVETSIPEETTESQTETSVSQVTTSEAVITTVSQIETSTPEETTESQTETSVSPAITTVSQVSTSAETTISNVTTPEITKRTDEHGNIVITVGDVNEDGMVSALDAAIIARKLAEGRSSDLNKWAADYNGDGRVTAQDCADIAHFLAKVSIIEHTTAPNEDKTETTKTTVKLNEPNKKNYDLSKFSGIKKYVNDCIKYKAATEYGITKIIYDDTVDPWDGYGWDIPAEYIPNIEYYKEHNDPILPAGLRTTADELVSESYCALYMMVEEWKVNYYQLIKDGWLKDCSEYEYISGATLTVTWKALGGGNYQLYIMW